MGLDGVELLMDVEETFGVNIPDEVAQNFRTVGELHEYLFAQCLTDRQAACHSSAAFYLIRQVICQTLPVERRQIRPGTRIEELATRSEFPRFWFRLQQSLVALRLPGFGRPMWLAHAAIHAGGYAVLLALATVVAWLFAVTQLGPLVLPLLALEIALIVGWLILAPTIAWNLPRNFQTVGELATLTARRNSKWFAARQQSWSEARLWEVLQRSISNTLGVELSVVTPQARFVEDLGI